MKTRKVLKQLFAMLLALILVVATGVTHVQVHAEDLSADVRTILNIPMDLSGKTIIIHTNDIHGAISRYAYVASLRDNLKGRGADVILVDAGDFSQGTPYVSTTKGLDAITMMNAAGYDFVTLGNHEFDYGYEQLRSNLNFAKFKVLCANILNPEGNNLFTPNAIYTGPSGLRIGFFGMETPETRTKVNPSMIKGLNFLNKSDNYVCAQAQVDELKTQGADLVICLSHLGVDEESALDGNRSVDLYANTNGIDFMIDGHSHTVMTAGSAGEPVQSTGTKCDNIGIVQIDNATKTIDDHYLITLENLAQEVTTSANANLIFQRVNSEYDKVLGHTAIDLNGQKDPGNRTQETNLGDLITDALKWSVLKEKDALSVDEDHVVAITNGGGIRASIDAGAITKNDINTVLPFGNTIAVVYVTGEELLEVLEASTFCTPSAIGGYPQTSGIKFTIDTTKPYQQGEAYPDSTYYAPAAITRVTIESINGKPFSLTDTYAVVTNNFCAAGGDTYYRFLSASDQFDTGIVMDEAVMAYVSEVLGGNVTADKYGDVRGDQTIIR
ncbi:bifunctional metallophosphatase/5'-nucleotidase [Butyrivibrio fibrisolvens]|uniref:bifunctional metallophosphatase/5'-nucleotidase n=1 Tax=Butyrivibrio fibrisolvens TaxID=831 RepID=UPI0020BE4D40|nr:bifunctional UDP-sugar hydrolase/5'-nucleotidase [Butyrivibrio fibrisolvens]